MTHGLFSTPMPMRIARSDLYKRMEVEVSLAKAEAAEAAEAWNSTCNRVAQPESR